MDWVDQLIDAAEWREIRGWSDHSRNHGEDWEEIEAGIGATLPSDFKRLREVFGLGAFCGYLELFNPERKLYSLQKRWKRPGVAALFDPYEIFDGTCGLIPWGGSVTEAQYYWLADVQVDSLEWPIVAREDPIEDWNRYDVTTSEFVWRVLSDPDFRPVSVAARVDRIYFEAYE